MTEAKEWCSEMQEVVSELSGIRIVDILEDMLVLRLSTHKQGAEPMSGGFHWCFNSIAGIQIFA